MVKMFGNVKPKAVQLFVLHQNLKLFMKLT